MRGDKALKGALHGFLDTYVSRYSTHDGYWLFGFLVPELTKARVDLLTPSSDFDARGKRVGQALTSEQGRHVREQFVAKGSVIRERPPVDGQSNAIELSAIDPRPHFRSAIECATKRFHEQATKWKLDTAILEVAVLTLARKETVVIDVNGRPTDAWRVSVSIDAAIRGGPHWTAERMILVAAHDPAHERRSANPERHES